MGNFSFLKLEWPEIYRDCAQAESYMASDPRSACFYARRAVELLVRHLYELIPLSAPYKTDLAALTNDAQFTATVGSGIQQKLNLLRRVGNTAVHDSRPIPARTAVDVLRQLYDVIIWAAFNYSTRPESVPTGSQFDPALAAKSAPLTHDQVLDLARKFKEQDEALAGERAASEAREAAYEEENARLREQVRQAQAAKTAVDTHDYSEAETRDLFIDVLLREAGWTLSEKRDREYPVSGLPGGGRGFIDYVLWGSDGLPLAVVEAKRTRKSAVAGQEQAKQYADALERETDRRPVIFYTNGYEHWLWDDAAGYPPREVRGFYTRDELELLIQRRAARRSLSDFPVSSEIAGRFYQTRAIRAINDVFDKKQREALLVMATGTGKTRTVISLVDQLSKAGWVKRVLFLADRTALVTQAANAFREHLPSAPLVKLTEDKSGEGRVFFSTYPTMLNLINAVDEASGRKYGPGFFDLVVIDEAHRSVFAKYRAIFEYFDSLLVGLTATPKDEVDHNTYRLFNLEDGVPTDAYSLEEAISHVPPYLVPPRGVSVGTKFLRQGIKYSDLSPDEKDQWDALDWGEDDTPDEVGAQELNRFLFNEDTADKVLATLMSEGHKVAGGDRLGKTIIFAKNQKHAEFIEKRFNIGWPEYSGDFARVITHEVSRAQDLIDDFSMRDKDPHIAISVDMLDTGIDVPEVVNLVFFKAVFSKSKFWQMIGRGTRLCPDLYGPGQDKEDFYVFDFCGNLEFFQQNLPTTEGSSQKSLSQRIFESRLSLVTALDDRGTDARLRALAAWSLFEYVSGMSMDNVLVRPHRRAVERFADQNAWDRLDSDAARDALSLAGLPSSAKDLDEQAKRFDLLILNRQLAQLEGDAAVAERVRETVQDIAEVLLGKLTIPSVMEQKDLLEAVASEEWWVDVTLELLERVRLRVRSLVQFVERTGQHPMYTDFEDTLGERTDVELAAVTPGTNFERFRAKASAYLRKHEDHVALQKLRRNKQLTAADLDSLEEMLLAAGGGEPDIHRASEESGGLGVFIRSLVGLDREAVTEAFRQFLDGSQYSVDQVRFIEMMVDELTANGVMDPSRLFESPYTDRAPLGPDMVFSDPDLTIIVDILHDVRHRAEVTGVA